MLHTAETAMNLNQLVNPLIAILTPRPSIDMDAVTNLGPEIARHLNCLNNLCDNIPNSQNLKDQVDDLRSLFSTYVPMQDNMLEKNSIAETVVYRRDSDDPMNKSEILILGGAGRYTVAGLRNKVAREAAQLADYVAGSDVNYRGAAHLAKQTTNSINTMVAAIDELDDNEINEGNTDSPSVAKLKQQLTNKAKNGENLDYNAIDSIMKNICKADSITTSTLHNMFMSSTGQTPDSWIRKLPVSEQMVKHDSLKSVGMLRNELVKHFRGKNAEAITDNSVNNIVKNVLAKTRRTDMNSLLQAWKSSKAGLTPLQWAKQAPDIHDPGIHYTKINAPIDESMRELCVIEMYETMKIGLGDRAWVAISKRLKSEGHDPELVEAVVNRAIIITGT